MLGGKEAQQFWALCPNFWHLKHCLSFMHLACLTEVSLDKVMALTSMALRLCWECEEGWTWRVTCPA